MDDFQIEVQQMRRMIERKKTEQTLSSFGEDKLLGFSKFVSSYGDAFFLEMNRLVQIACIIPITSVEAERSFSCLKLIKTHTNNHA